MVLLTKEEFYRRLGQALKSERENLVFPAHRWPNS
jgi:hypothetical protein